MTYGAHTRRELTRDAYDMLDSDKLVKGRGRRAEGRTSLGGEDAEKWRRSN
jgi:hypothetical protein